MGLLKTKSLNDLMSSLFLALIVIVLNSIVFVNPTVYAYESSSYVTQINDGRLTGSSTTGFNQAQQLIKKNGYLYYADIGTGSVVKSKDGQKTAISGRSGPDITYGMLHDATDGQAAVNSKIVPYGIEVDDDGSLYIADAGSHKVFKVVADGLITTVAGNGESGQIQNAIDAKQTVFNAPNYVKFGPDHLL